MSSQSDRFRARRVAETVTRVYRYILKGAAAAAPLGAAQRCALNLLTSVLTLKNVEFDSRARAF